MDRNRKLFTQLKKLVTEQRNEHTRRIDSAQVTEIINMINREDRKVAAAVAREARYITRAVDLVVRSLRNGGRLIYVGAGTSGRLGILDASECPPTFGTDPSLVQGIIAGGKNAVFRSREGVEDNARDGRNALRRLSPKHDDVVCCIAASMRTPFVLGAMQEAKRNKARVIFVTTNPRKQLQVTAFSEFRKMIDIAICPVVGPEVIMGSTRMKSGTAQKMVLNMITTAAMIQMGKVYENMMVDLKMNSRKLSERAKRVTMIATGADYASASRALSEARGHVKTAIVMITCNIPVATARVRLRRAHGFVRYAIADKPFTPKGA